MMTNDDNVDDGTDADDVHNYGGNDDDNGDGGFDDDADNVGG